MLIDYKELSTAQLLISFELMDVCIHCHTAIRTFEPFTIDDALLREEKCALFTGGVCSECNFTLIKTPVPLQFVHRMQNVKNQMEFTLVLADLKSWLSTIQSQVEEKVNEKRLMTMD